MGQQTGDLVSPDSWYLSIVGISPPFQGRGLGKGLLKEILALADSAGISTYLETFVARNKKFYQQLGYVEKGSLYEPTVNSEYWVMVRNPQ
jgi:GNAT superfamily N-acetyltransferase